MNKEYAIYPFRYMNITQRHDQGNHAPHWKNVTNHSDKPWDEACKDAGQSYFEPKNDFIVEEVIGLDTSSTKNYTNAVRLKSVNKLMTPYGKEDYLYVTLTHMNESNLKQVKKGQVLKAGSKVLMEGTDGQATGNHFHITANFGKYYGLLKNNNGKYCFTYEKSLLPNEAFYLDKSYTTVKNARNYVFKEVPKTTTSSTATNQIIYYKKYTGKSTSIVDALKSIGVDGSFSNRKKIANINSISLYVGLASQNTKMLNLLKNGKLIKSK